MSRIIRDDAKNTNLLKIGDERELMFLTRYLAVTNFLLGFKIHISRALDEVHPLIENKQMKWTFEKRTNSLRCEMHLILHQFFQNKATSSRGLSSLEGCK